MIKRSKQSGIQISKGLTASLFSTHPGGGPPILQSLKMLAIYLRRLAAYFFEDELVTIYAQTLETMPPFPAFTNILTIQYRTMDK